MTSEEFDYFNWRIDQIHKMIVDLAWRLGQGDMGDSMNQFHNDQVVAESKIIEAALAATEQEGE